MNWRVLLILLLPLMVKGQVPQAGNVGPQPSAYSRHLLTLPNMSQWQGELNVNPNGQLVPGTNITFQVGSGFTVINATGGGTNTNTLPLFTSTNATLAGGMILVQPHGLGVVPSILRAVLVCVTNNLNMTNGVEYDCAYAAAWNGTVSAPYYQPVFGVFADATNVYVNQAATVSGIVINNYGNVGNGNPITPGDWRVKVYARP